MCFSLRVIIKKTLTLKVIKVLWQHYCHHCYTWAYNWPSQNLNKHDCDADTDLKFENIPRRWAVSNPLPAPSPQNAAAALRRNDYAVLHVHPSNIFHPLLLRFHLQL